MFLDAVPLKDFRLLLCENNVQPYCLGCHEYILSYNILMIIAFKTELKLNNVQRTQMSKHAGTARHAYNWGLSLCKSILDHNKSNPEGKIKFPSAIDLHKWLVALVKPEFTWYSEVSKCAPQYALRDLRMAWDRCFKKISGAPNFKKKGRCDSFELDGTIKIRGERKIQVPRLGVLKTYEELPQVPVKSVTISRTADRWFISFKIEIEPSVTPQGTGEPVRVASHAMPACGLGGADSSRAKQENSSLVANVSEL